jgi:hypothetical protein
MQLLQYNNTSLEKYSTQSIKLSCFRYSKIKINSRLSFYSSSYSRTQEEFLISSLSFYSKNKLSFFLNIFMNCKNKIINNFLKLY